MDNNIWVKWNFSYDEKLAVGAILYQFHEGIFNYQAIQNKPELAIFAMGFRLFNDPIIQLGMRDKIEPIHNVVTLTIATLDIPITVIQNSIITTSNWENLNSQKIVVISTIFELVIDTCKKVDMLKVTINSYLHNLLVLNHCPKTKEIMSNISN